MIEKTISLNTICHKSARLFLTPLIGLVTLLTQINIVRGQSLIPPVQDNPALPTIDLLVLYTPQAAGRLVERGQTPAIQAAIDLHNQILANSNINARINLVGIAQIPFNENIITDKSTGFEAHEKINVSLGLDRSGIAVLESNRDDFGIRRLRDLYGADLVTIWVELNGFSSSSSVSSGFKFDDPANLSFFSTIIASKANNRYHFAHEVGHNLGLGHDVPNNRNPRDGANGHVLKLLNPDVRTVMAYAGPQCEDRDRDGDKDWYDCQRIPYYSNPEVRYSGVPTGITREEDENYLGANNAAQFQSFAPRVAQYRLREEKVDCDISRSGYELSGYKCVYGDVDGDGDKDLISFRTSRGSRVYGDVFIKLWTVSGYHNAGRWLKDFCQGDSVCHTGDFDGDDKDDIIRFRRSDESVHVAISTGNSFATPTKWDKPFCGRSNSRSGWCGVADINGDGKDDIVQIDPLTGIIFAAKSNGQRFGRNRYRGYFPCVTRANRCKPFAYDYDNDGDDDILSVWDGQNGVKCVIAVAGKYTFTKLIQSGGCRSR